MCELFIASVHTLGVEANGEAPLFITHLGHTKIFFFLLVAACTAPPPQPLYFITGKASDTSDACYALRFADQLMFWFVLVQYLVGFFNTLFAPFFTFWLTSLFCYVMKCAEAIIQCALCPIKRLVQQPLLIILFNLVLTSNLHFHIELQYISPLWT